MSMGNLGVGGGGGAEAPFTVKMGPLLGENALVLPYNGNDPTSPWKAKSPFASRPFKISIKGNARDAREVRRCTSSIHFHRTVPQSSSHTGPRQIAAISVC